MVDGTKIEETTTLESSVSKMFCICMTTNASDKETKKQINQRSTEQHNSQVSNQACPFIVPAFTVSTSSCWLPSWLTQRIGHLANPSRSDLKERGWAAVLITVGLCVDTALIFCVLIEDLLEVSTMQFFFFTLAAMLSFDWTAWL